MRTYPALIGAAAAALLVSTSAEAAQQPVAAANASMPKKMKPGSGKRPQVLRPAARGKIINGVPARAGLLPYQVSLFRPLDGHFCGGSLIDSQWVLTAAHCIMWMDLPTGFKVLGGTNHLLTGGQVFDVDSVYVHPDYNEDTSENDIALVKVVAQPVRSGNSLRAISAFSFTTDTSRQLVGAAIVSGFGSTEEGGNASPQLLMADVPVVSNDTCNAPESYNGEIFDSMVCAGGEQKDSCQGDSGGPLVVGDEQRGFALIGVVSFGEGCARPLKYGVYTRVASFADWIRSVMQQ